MTRSIVTGLAVGVGWAWGLYAAVAGLLWWLDRGHAKAEQEKYNEAWRQMTAANFGGRARP